MAGFLARETIDEVVRRADIVQLVGEYVPLAQRGNDWWGCCPFHNEKTPSFSVSPEKHFYYCFGCHATGTAVDFLKEMEKLSFPEAVAQLAKKAGVELRYADSGEVPREDPGAKLKAEYRALYGRVATTFHYMLMETEAGRFALDYILGRGITRETLEKFKLGYAPANRRWLRQFLAKKNFSREFLDGSGLFSRRYPEFAFFSDRLMFPIFDRRGEVVAMGGRFLRGDSKKSPKYLNSGDLVQYKKGGTLYAFNFARQAMRESRRAIFCEGYMDCIAYHQCGIAYAVAPLGTALTEEQVALVRPFVDTVLLSFDSDGAGQNATRRAILMCRQKGLTVRVIRLAGGKDPAEIMVNFGAETLTNDVDGAILDNDYLLSKLLEVYPKSTPEGKAKASLEFFAYVDSLQSDVQKDACLEQLCQAYEIDPEAVRRDYTNRDRLSQRARRSADKGHGAPGDDAPIRPTAELRAVLTAVADDSGLFQRMRAEISPTDLDDPQAKKLFAIMEECGRSGTFSVSSVLNRCDSEGLRELVIQSVSEYSAHAEQSLLDGIALVRRKALGRKRDELMSRIRGLERSALAEDKAQLMALLPQKMELDRQMALLKG